MNALLLAGPRMVRRWLVTAGVSGGVLCAGAVADGQCSLAFVPAVNYGVSQEPFSVAVGDFNGDARADLAVGMNTSAPTSLVGVLLGNGDGTFQAARYSSAGPRNTTPIAVGVGDFNADGRLDLVVANGGVSTVSVLVGNGDGTFQAPALVTVGTDPKALVVSDFNADGQADVAVASRVGGVGVLIGNGDGTFRGAVMYADELSPSSIAAADLNGDGRLDLVVANLLGDNVSVLLGTGGEAFAPAMNYAAGASGCAPRAVVVGEFNGQPGLDLAVANRAGGVAVLAGNGDGTFRAPVSYALPDGDGPEDLALADFDGDGRVDLGVAITDVLDNYCVAVLTAEAGGGFAPATMFSVGTTPYAIATGDFNRDGRPDAATANVNGPSVSVLLNAGIRVDWDRDGAVEAADFYRFLQDFFAGAADVNGSGATDSQDLFDYLNAFLGGCR